jgi:hypothetical protein
MDHLASATLTSSPCGSVSARWRGSDLANLGAIRSCTAAQASTSASPTSPISSPQPGNRKGHPMTEAAVSFAGNLTDDPEVRYTESGIARAMLRVAVSGRRDQ